MDIITSTSNNLIKHTKKLLYQKKYRQEYNQFVIEGHRLVWDAIKHGADIEKIFISENISIPVINIPVYTVSESVMKEITDTLTPQGIVAIANIKEYKLDDCIKDGSTFIVFCDNISDPGNLGTIIRTADAAGVTGVIIGEGCVDIYNPKTIRATMSSIFNVPIFICHNNLDTLNNLKEKSITLTGTSLNTNKLYYDINFEKDTLLVMGSEANGITSEILEICDNIVKIPILGNVESLNVAVATSIVMYEVVKQRKS